MNKTELTAVMAEKMGTTKKAAGEAVEAFVEAVTEELVAGGKVSLVGFGTFSVAERAQRMGRNPQTGAEILIPESKAPKFKAGSALKGSLK